MKLALCILNYNSKSGLDKWLAAIDTYPPTCSYHIYFIDNASEDGSFEYFYSKYGKRENITCIQNGKNFGFGAGYNRVLKTIRTRYEYICLLNADIEIWNNTLKTLIAYLDQHPKTGIIGPQLIYEDGVVQDSYRRFPSIIDQTIKRTFLKKIPWLRRRVRWYLMWDKDKNKTEPVDWMVGAFLMMRTNALAKVGLFDERFFLFFEDIDLCRRMWQAGYEVIYHPKAQAQHHHERLSSGGILDIFRKKTLRIHIISGIKYFWKWLGRKS